MSDIIHLLPDSVANQIAAGEVIQRPASVVKELVENAIDAGARHITLRLIDAGRTLLQVIDDGHGMSETDARLAFERHATSKISRADDLFDLHTMGFRGEALPSIVAVSQVELTTRTADDELGTRLLLSASRVESQEPVACAVGSNFIVRNLFFNVPARRRFLKSDATELSHILAAFERIALVYPSIAFSLHSGGGELMNLREGSLLARISDVFGKRLASDLLPVEVDTSLCRLSGFVAKPEAARKKGARTFFFVNGRYMRHPYFHKAVTGAYERLIPEGSQPSYFLYFDVSPADIDVNIHPTKTEIKFENEQGIWQILSAAVKDAIGRFSQLSTIDFDTEGRPEIPVFDPTREAVALPRVDFNPSYNPFHTGASASARPIVPPSRESVGNLFDDTQDDALSPDPVLQPVGGDAPARSLLSSASGPIYQYKATYLMTAVKSGLMIIDQHRADERILYERYLDRLSRRSADTQCLLFPEVLRLSPSEAVDMERVMPALSALGFDVSDLGGGSYAVGGVPTGLDGLRAVDVVRGIISDASSGVDASQIHASVASSLARQAAIPHGQVLSPEEMERIVGELFACQTPTYTPDGRLVLTILPQADLDALFQGL